MSAKHKFKVTVEDVVNGKPCDVIVEASNYEEAGTAALQMGREKCKGRSVVVVNIERL